jgi:hypothetical protein
MKRYFAGKITSISRQVSHDSLLGVFVVICQSLMDESEMTRTQMETHYRSENGHSAWDALRDATS